MKRTILTVLLATALMGFVWLGVTNVDKTNQKLKTQDIQLKSKQADLLELELKFDTLNKELEQKNLDAEKARQLEQEKQQLQKQLDDAHRALQAKAEQREAEKRKVAQAASLSATAYAATGNQYKDFIYGRESGNCPTRWQGKYGACPAYHGTPSNPNVGYGLCQATPGWKMASAGADWATSYETQDRWCTQYANKYGGWAGAYAFWVNNHWW